MESGSLTSLSLFPCFVGQRHPTNSMMEIMTMTRKATWRFRRSWACYVPRNSFLPLGWVGGKKCGSPTPGQVTFRAFTSAGGGFGDHIWFLNQPLSSLPQGLRMVPIKDRMGTRIAISRKAWAWALEASPSPFGLLIPSLLPSNPETSGVKGQTGVRLPLTSSSPGFSYYRPCFQCR